MASTCFLTTITSVAAIISAEKSFPPKTPKRWNLIAQFVRKSNPENSEEPQIVLGASSKPPTKFIYSADHCKQLFSILNDKI